MGKPSGMPIQFPDTMTATLTPHLLEIAPASFTVPRGWAATASCHIDRGGVRWGEQHVAFEDLTAVAYKARRISRNLVQRQTARSVWLTTPTQRLHIALGHERFGPNRSGQYHEIYGSLVEALHTHAEPRLRAESIRTLAAGQDIWIGHLRLDRHGIHNNVKQQTMHWRQLPVAQVEGDIVSVRAVIEAGPNEPQTVPMQAANAVLLPELVAEASLLFC
jgi:hypothetical protein